MRVRACERSRVHAHLPSGLPACAARPCVRACACVRESVRYASMRVRVCVCARVRACVRQGACACACPELTSIPFGAVRVWVGVFLAMHAAL